MISDSHKTQGVAATTLRGAFRSLKEYLDWHYFLALILFGVCCTMGGIIMGMLISMLVILDRASG